jgi:hypothetical protein
MTPQGIWVPHRVAHSTKQTCPMASVPPLLIADRTTSQPATVTKAGIVPCDCNPELSQQRVAQEIPVHVQASSNQVPFRIPLTATPGNGVANSKSRTGKAQSARQLCAPFRGSRRQQLHGAPQSTGLPLRCCGATVRYTHHASFAIRVLTSHTGQSIRLERAMGSDCAANASITHSE